VLFIAIWGFCESQVRAINQSIVAGEHQPRNGRETRNA
jgi:hypothetical protein